MFNLSYVSDFLSQVDLSFIIHPIFKYRLPISIIYADQFTLFHLPHFPLCRLCKIITCVYNLKVSFLFKLSYLVCCDKQSNVLGLYLSRKKIVM